MRKTFLAVLIGICVAFSVASILSRPAQVYPIYYADGQDRKMAKVLSPVRDEEECMHAVYGLQPPAMSLVYFDCAIVPQGEKFDVNNLSKYQVVRNGPG